MTQKRRMRRSRKQLFVPEFKVCEREIETLSESKIQIPSHYYNNLLYLKLPRNKHIKLILYYYYHNQGSYYIFNVLCNRTDALRSRKRNKKRENEEYTAEAPFSFLVLPLFSHTHSGRAELMIKFVVHFSPSAVRSIEASARFPQPRLVPLRSDNRLF